MKYPRLSNIPTIGQKLEPNSGINGIVGKQKDTNRWRDLTAYWILGLCNNYGYVVMLSAAHDIVEQISGGENHNENQQDHDGKRACNLMSTGVVLLADILPSLIIKSLCPFLPFFINVRVFLACFMQCCGFLMVAFANTEWMAMTGVILTSASSGLGEASFLSYSSRFHKNVISTWSSGTGGAGIVGASSYAILRSLGVGPVKTMLIMLCVPLIEGAAFWILLRNPCTIPKKNSELDFKTCSTDQETGSTDVKIKMSLCEKICYTPSLMKYMIPLSLVYFFEYFINQGLFELIDFRGIWLDRKSQYRWLQVDYQIGVFISRSSVNVFKLDKIWLMAVFQLINVAVFLTEVITFFSPTIWLIFGIVLWEGLLGGGAYVNTFYRMSKEIPEEKRNFALGVVCMADSIGISFAGLFAMPVHNNICLLSLPERATSLLDIFK